MADQANRSNDHKCVIENLTTSLPYCYRQHGSTDVSSWAQQVITRAARRLIFDTEERMICDICNATMESAAGLLGTKEVVTSQECWRLYFVSSIRDGVLSLQDLEEPLTAYVCQMASSDTPWALCATCISSLQAAGLPPSLGRNDLPTCGHALCRSPRLMQFVVQDEAGMSAALEAATKAASEILLTQRQGPTKQQHCGLIKRLFGRLFCF